MVLTLNRFCNRDDINIYEKCFFHNRDDNYEDEIYPFVKEYNDRNKFGTEEAINDNYQNIIFSRYFIHILITGSE